MKTIYVWLYDWNLTGSVVFAEMSTECPPIQKLPTEGKQAERLASLQEKFNRKYNKAPEFFARAPGRWVICFLGLLLHYNRYFLPLYGNVC